MTDHAGNPSSPLGSDLWDALARYVAGESSGQEADAVRQWLQEDAQRSELVASLQRSIDSLAFSPPKNLDVEAALRRVKGRLNEAEVIPLRSSEPSVRRWRTMGLRAAAAIALLVGSTLVWRPATVGSRPGAGAGPGPVLAARTYTTSVGRSDSIHLADGSLAILGPASELTVASGYGKSHRSVSLKGVGLFDVRHDALHPFSVQAGDAVVQDMGTTFSVWNDDGAVRVVVTAGSVLLQGTNPSHQGAVKRAQPAEGGVVLSAGDRGSVGHDGRAIVERAAAPDQDLAWTRGQLVFDNVPLSRVRADLRRWYGVDLQIADSSLAGRHLTASFAGEPVERVLDVIALALGAKIERRGEVAIVRAR
jgi:transmembrane sensor